MHVQEILATFERLGKPQTAAIYKRHGAGENVFGVLTSEIAKLQKKIKIDHVLGVELWKTENAEARLLALLISDPERLTATDADRLVTEAPVRFLGSYLCAFVARSPLCEQIMHSWMQSSDALFREMGYGVMSVRLKDAPNSLSDAELEMVLIAIEEEIHCAPNWTRHAMNGAIICIGVYKPTLRTKAIEVARRIGKLKVDHGETNCKTPDAVAYIEKVSKRKCSP